MPRQITTFAFAVALASANLAGPAVTQDKSIVVASTTSTQDSGLFEYLIPIFPAKNRNCL